MKKSLFLSLIAAVALSAAAMAQDPSQSDAQKPEQVGQQPNTSAQASKNVTGTISSVNMDQKMFVVKTDAGPVTVYWTDATRGSADLKEGASVVIQTADQDGKTVATSVQVKPSKAY